MCERLGRITAAAVVDHIQPHRGSAALFWNASNWQALCRRCHDSRKQMLERGDKIPPHPSWGGG
jgi:5-methylcytosine-specific restriction protein A